MNLFQFIAILLLITIYIVFLYFNTNKFEKGWFNNIRQNKYKGQGGFVYFRVVVVVAMLALYVLKDAFN